MNKRYGANYERRLFESLVNHREPLESGRHVSRIVAYILAGAVHSTTLVFGALGIFFIVHFWPNFIFLFFGILSLAIAWVTFPRMEKKPNNVLDREKYKTLYGIVERIAAELGLKSVDGIVVNHEFNASFYRVGWIGKNYFDVGLPLFSILDVSEKVAILGHEVAHGVNKDSQRSVFVGTALMSLERWYELLMPESLFSSESGLSGVFMLPINLLMMGIAKIVQSLYTLLIMILFRDKQRAEYLADLLSTRVSGSSAMIAALEKLYAGNVFELAMQRVTLDKKKDFVEELRKLVHEMPSREVERLRRVARLEGNRIDATHPPTPLRIAFIEYHPAAPAVRIDRTEEEALEAEFNSLVPKIQTKLIDEYREYLYEL
ncbi:MAG: M48 family metallopeptidase [Candidatus Kapaibacterium sp.]